jgi:type IV pilus assembly protein PilY1
MKCHFNSHSITRRHMLSLALTAGLALPLPALTASLTLATAPLATSTTSTVQPNLLFVLDDSGSMTWTYMPDEANNFHGNVGYQSSQCNGVYYNPDITYLPPLDSAGASYANASFTAARDNGFDPGSTARNLNTAFIANRFSPDSANTTYNDSSRKSYLYSSLGPYAAHYYTYSGSQTTKNYFSTGSTFYTECNSDFGVIAGNGSNVFTKVSLSSTATATTATIVVSGTNSTSVSGIKMNGTEEIMADATATDAGSSAVATKIAAQINLCTSAKVGNCTTTGGHGYSATVSSSTVTITGLAATAKALIITKGNTGTMLLSPTIFPVADAAKLTNFANWYSFYRTRMQMMKTASGRAFSSLTNNYRVGLMKINSSGTPALTLGTFEDTQRTDWYSTLYDTAPDGSTPLRTALANAGRYYAGRLSVADPLQYSCQQNFTILSTDGYWNDSSNPNQVDGSTDIGNQDGTAGRAMYDGAQATDTVTTTYTRNTYNEQRNAISGDNAERCSSGYSRIIITPETRSCSVTSGVTTCTSAVAGNKVYQSPYSADKNTCVDNDTISAPSDTAWVATGTPVTTTGSVGGTSNTLADVAMYYYQTDLRTTDLSNCGTPEPPATVGPLCENNVFIGGNDSNTQQHMTTFTLGLGANGRMVYSSSYLNDSSGDFVAVRLGSTASSTVCTWQTAGTVCNWPIPGSGDVENIDDLWHAAVDGRGAYFSATNPASLSAGLASALAGINARKGSAAAAATSTLNPVAGNNFAYVASYTTVAWKGNLEARGINTETGVVAENATWCVENVPAGTCASPGTIVAEDSGDTTVYNCVTPDSVICNAGTLVGTDCKVPVATACTGTMNTKVTDASDTRTIKTANSTGTALVDFSYANLTATQQGYFAAAHIGTLSQWSSLTAAQQTAAAGANLVNFLRGQYGFEDRTAVAADNRLYRYREAVLGDALESQPAFIGSPVFSYPYPGYAEFKTAQASRSGTVYMGTNDGMMHAFASDTGIERWAYVPSMVMPNMWKLADKNYSTLHTNFVNGSPITTDVCTAADCSVATSADWKTILVGGLNGGGRGYYALDITDPATPVLLWEFTPASDSDVGYSFGQAVITRASDGTWVVLVTSGYNNTGPGDGKGYLYVLNASTGAVISKIATGVGDTTTPSGLSRIAAWNDEPLGNKAGPVYGGDLLGNLWRFDINTGDVLKFATLYSSATVSSSNLQPITTTPVLGNINGKRVVFIGTGKYLETGDLTTTQPQTQYAIMDDNATSTLINPRNTLVHVTLVNDPSTGARTSTGSTVSFTGRGWFADFPDSGERVNIDSNLVQGILLVPSIVPSNTACSPGGFGWLNFFDYKTGSATAVKFDATIVGVNVIYIQGQPLVEVVTSSNPTPEQPSTQPPFHGSAGGFSSRRTIWRELIP